MEHESSPPLPPPSPRGQQFLEQSREASPGILAEFLAFVLENKKWWLLPILVLLGLMGFLVMLSGSAVAPFLYPLF